MARQPAKGRSASRRPAPARKTAVVVIHGMGEQRPMDTLRGFVQAAWVCDASLVAPRTVQIYSKPDQITGSFELRRITTRPWTRPDPRRVDFFEFYWAHLMQGNTLAAVLGWLKDLMLRPPSRVPRRLLGGWLAGLATIAAIVAFLVLAKYHDQLLPKVQLWWLWTGLPAVLGLASAVWLRPVLGDAARYLSPAPGNVSARQAIREAGVDLIAKLHASGQYDRIVVVGHSLGSVIGYDVLNYAWGRIAQADFAPGHAAGSPAMIRLGELEKAAGALLARGAPATALSDYRTAQRAYFAELSRLKDRKKTPLWLVSDLVTLGCPLSSSDVLLAADAADLEARKARRETPTSPPWLEKQKPPRFSYPTNLGARTPHHAAVFGPTVWTNVFFPSLGGLIGDFISGPVAPQLGPGVRDVRVPIGAPRFRHLDYWRDPKSNAPWIRALRRALNLRQQDESTVWGLQATANPVRAEKL